MRAPVLTMVAALLLGAIVAAQQPETRTGSEIDVAAAIRKANIALIEQLERDVEDPPKLPSVRTRLDGARRAAASLGEEWEARVQSIADFLARTGFEELDAALQAAKTKAAAGKLTEALATCDAAVLRFNRELDGLADLMDRAAIDRFKRLIAYSDSLVEKLETPEFEAKVPERDMLSAQERRHWGKSVACDFEVSPTGLTVQAVPIEKGKVIGVVSVLPSKAAPWHDLVIDLEFTLLSGEMEMYVRYWPDKKSYLIRFAPAHGYELNKAYRMTIRVKGSQISLKQPDQPENRDRFVADTSRTGGVGFGLSPGSKAVISKLNVKVLR